MALLQNTLLWIAAAVGAVLMAVFLLLYDWIIDDPSVVREARREYIKITELEKVAAERDAAEKLLKIEIQTSERLRGERNAQRQSTVLFQADLNDAVSANKELRDEVEELRALSGRDDLPRVDDLGLRLRNR